MNISQLPREKMVDEDGNITLAWRRFFSQMVHNFIFYLSDEGYQLPLIELPSTPSDYPRSGVEYKGMIFYDKRSNKFIANVDGELKEIQTKDL